MTIPSGEVKTLIILGSTGSIGRQTLDVVRAFPHRFRVLGLAAGWNTELLLEQAREFRPQYICHANGSSGLELFSELGSQPLSMEEMVALPEVDLVMVGTSGRAGLFPILEGIKHGKSLALANKEPIIMAGEFIVAEARRCGATLLAVDSEPSAIWQCLRGEDQEIRRIILTASGGPFRHRSAHDLAQVTREEALRHPTWRMGRKITIDSATLMNKGMEIIEAHWLFDVPYEKIEVVIHPQSAVHSMVEFVDGSVKGKISPPDMRLPIQYALTYPERWSNPNLPQFDPIGTGQLSFERLDAERFPCFRLAVEAGRLGGTYPTALAASDEVAVGLFLNNQIGFMEIPKLVEATLAAHRSTDHPTLEEVLAADAWAREFATSQVAA